MGLKSYRIASAFIALLSGPAANSAHAGIRCNGEFQVNSAGEFGSPFCQEDALARAARSYGLKATAGQVHKSYGLQMEMCRVMSNDIRVSNFCSAQSD